MDEVTIEVTQEDIKNGVRDNMESCPIANAIRRKFAGIDYVAVDGCEMGWRRGNSYYMADTPEEANEFMNEFDHGSEVKPFAFSIYVECDDTPKGKD